MSKQSKYITIKEATKIYSVNIATIYRKIQQGILTCEYRKERGKNVKLILKRDADKIFSIVQIAEDKSEHKDNSLQIERENTANIKDEVRQVITEFFNEKQAQIMRPIEEQALFVAGKLSQENCELREKMEVLRQENDLLREQIKALPGPSELEGKDNVILLLKEEQEALQKQIELLPAKPEKVTEILLQNAENIKFLQEELSSTAALAEIKIDTLKEQAEKDKEEALQALNQKKEEEKLELVQAWQKKVDEVYNHPWWKFW